MVKTLLNKFIYIIVYLCTFPLGFGAFIIDIINIFLKKENKTDVSYFLTYIDEINKYTKELLCSKLI